MGQGPHHLSIFSQALDRVAFVAYFLGAVVPLAALAWVAQQFVFPQLPPGAASLAAGGALAALGVLSLASFLALRRVARSTLARLDGDNRRLETLLEASQTLADARFADEVHRTAARCAAAITGADAAFVFDAEAEKEAAPHLVATAGDAAMELYREGRATLDEVVAPVLVSRRPALYTGVAGAPLRGVAAVAIPAGEGSPAALAVASAGSEARFGAAHLRPLATVAALVGVARANADLRDAQRNFFVHVTEILIAALDVHLDEPEGHSRRVAHLAVQLGRALGLADARLERLHFGALLHDVGMLKLDPRRQGARSHPQLGQRMLARIRLWEDLAPFVLYHHEAWDGGGYPEGLSGEDIPLEARIIAIAEAFDSTGEAAGSRAAPPERIREGRGTRFDPGLADRFLELVEQGVIEVPSGG